LLSTSDRARREKALKALHEEVLSVSALDGWGIDELKARLKKKGAQRIA
jgi:50S ribosomal subunit-associated GTPase HflX